MGEPLGCQLRSARLPRPDLPAGAPSGCHPRAQEAVHISEAVGLAGGREGHHWAASWQVGRMVRWRDGDGKVEVGE